MIKFIINEYLSMLKERDELDRLIPSLLTAMNIRPLSVPQIGVRQYGVDVAALGVDPKTNKETVFLLTLKKGDVDRQAWQGNTQSVRSSLDEICDVYISNHLEKNLSSYPIKVILSMNGHLDQSVQLNWSQYCEQHTVEGKLEFERWDIDYLTVLIELHLLNEQIFPESIRSSLRRTLAFIDLPEYDLSDFFKLIDNLLDQCKDAEESIIVKTLRSLNLCLEVLFRWSDSNIKPVFFASERLSLRIWDFIKNIPPSDGDLLWLEFSKIEGSRSRIGYKYFQRVHPHCFVKDSIFFKYRRTAPELEYPLIVFEQIGILSEIGLDCYFLYKQTNDTTSLENARVVAEALINLIHNMKVSNNALYDDHSIEISMALLLMTLCEMRSEASSWLLNLVDGIKFNYILRRRYPIFSESIDDLSELELADEKPKFSSSTLITILAEWSVVLGNKSIYSKVVEGQKKVFKDTNLQIWYPDGDIEKYFYLRNATEYGSTECNINLDVDIDCFRQDLLTRLSQQEKPQELSFINYGYLIIGIIAFRHFRTPVFPFYWRSLITEQIAN